MTKYFRSKAAVAGVELLTSADNTLAETAPAHVELDAAPSSTFAVALVLHQV